MGHKMDTLDTIIQRLRDMRNAYLAELDRINSALMALDPPKEIIPTPSMNQRADRIMAAIGDRELSTTEVRKATGLAPSTTDKTLKAMVENGVLVRRQVNHVNHYRQPREELKIVAGEGITDRKVS